MLQSIRSGSKSPLMKVFLLFLAGGFAIWGIGDVSTGLFGPGDKAIKAGSKSVSAIEVAREFDLLRRSQYNSISAGDALQFGLLNNVMSQMARTLLFEAEASKLNVVSTRSMQKSALLRQEAFQDEMGAFSQGRFISSLTQAGLSENDYFSQLNKSIISQQIADSVSLGAKYPENMSEELAKYELERRKAQIINFDIIPKQQPVPTNTEIVEWFDKNIDSYDAAALRSVKLLLISPESIKKDVQVSLDEMKEAFETRGSDFSKPERRVVRQMVFDTAEQALAARNAIDSGTEFEKVAETLLGLTKEDVMLGDLTYDDFDASMADAIFNAKAGNLIGPIESMFGYNLAIVDVIVLGSSDTFEDVREQIKIVLENEKAIDLVYDRLKSIEDALGTGATLEEVGLQNGLSTQIINDFDQQGNNIDGEAFTGIENQILSLNDFIETSWSYELDEISTVIDAGDDSFFIVQPLTEKEPRQRSFEEVKNRVLYDYALENAIATTLAKAQSYMKIGPSIFKDALSTTAFRRSGVGLDNANARLIAQAAFEQSLNGAKIIETGEQILIVKTSEILPANETEVKDTSAFYLSQLNLAASQNISEALSVRLSEIHKLELYPAMVQHLLVGKSN